MIELTVNGKPRELENEMGLVDFLDTLGINKNAIAVAHNGVVLRKDELPDVTIVGGDTLEIVRAVGGG